MPFFILPSSSGTQATILQEAHIPIISDAVCNAPDYYDNQVTTTMFCAGYEKGGTDSCQVTDDDRQIIQSTLRTQDGTI